MVSLYIVGSIPMFIHTMLLATNFLMYAGNGMTEVQMTINCRIY